MVVAERRSLAATCISVSHQLWEGKREPDTHWLPTLWYLRLRHARWLRVLLKYGPSAPRLCDSAHILCWRFTEFTSAGSLMPAESQIRNAAAMMESNGPMKDGSTSVEGQGGGGANIWPDLMAHPNFDEFWQVRALLWRCITWYLCSRKFLGVGLISLLLPAVSGNAEEPKSARPFQQCQLCRAICGRLVRC